jgi:hypothetical protein
MIITKSTRTNLSPGRWDWTRFHETRDCYPVGDRIAELCVKWAITCLASNLVKRIRTEEPDEVVPHVRICGECAGQPVHLPGNFGAYQIVKICIWIMQLSIIGY